MGPIHSSVFADVVDMPSTQALTAAMAGPPTLAEARRAMSQLKSVAAGTDGMVADHFRQCRLGGHFEAAVFKMVREVYDGSRTLDAELTTGRVVWLYKKGDRSKAQSNPTLRLQTMHQKQVHTI